MSFSSMRPCTKSDQAAWQRLCRRSPPGGGAPFGASMGDNIVPYAQDPVPEVNDRGGRHVNGWRIVFSGVVQGDWANPGGNLHGAASAWIVDVCTSAAIAQLSTDSFWGPPMLAGVSISLDMTYYNPAPIGSKIRIMVTVERMAGTLANTRCEITDWDTGRRLASGTHAKAWRPAKL